MRHLLMIAVAACLVVAGAALAAAEGDRAKLQGTWRVTALENEGKSVPAEELKKAQLIFEGDHYGLKGTKEEYRGKFTLHPEKSPKQIDTTFIEEGGKEKGRALGIYKLEGGKLTICWTQGKERPTEFKTKPGSGLRLLTAERPGK